MALKPMTVKLTPEDIATLDKHCSYYGATKTGTIRLMIDLLKSEESAKAFLDLAADYRSKK